MEANHRDYIPFAFETIIVPSGNVAATLTRSTYLPNRGQIPVYMALITVDPGPVITYTLTGLTVGSATGHKITAFDYLKLEGYTAIKNFQTTSNSSGTTGQISVTYFR